MPTQGDFNIRLGNLDGILFVGLRDVKLESTITAVPFYKKMGFSELGRGCYTHGPSNLKLPVINMALS